MTTAAQLRGMPLVAVLSLAAVCAGCENERQPPGPPPFAIEDVDFTADCAPNAAFERLLTVLLPQTASESDALPGFDEPLFDAVSGHTSHVLRFAKARNWHGLHLAEARLLFGIESGPANYSLVFADPPERVGEVWNARGWRLPPVGERSTLGDEVILTAVGVEADGELTTVTCFSD